MRNNPTDAERLLWNHLRLRQIDGNRFRRQQPLGGYIVDFVCLEKRLIVEIDGGQHAESVADSRRTRWLETEGWRVLRFWNHDILRRTDDVLNEIRGAVQQL